MLLPRFATAFTLVLTILCIKFAAFAQDAELEAHAKNDTVQDAPPPSCHVTLPAAGSGRLSYVPEPGRVGYVMVGAYGTENLSVLLPTNGIWWGLPNKPGDFAYSNKFPWRGTFSYTDGAGPLIVTGKRLDGLSPSFTEIQPITGRHWMMGGMSIPVFGCWQITGRYKDQELTFIVWVMPAVPKEPSAPNSSPQAAIPRSSDSDITIEPAQPVPNTQLSRIYVNGDLQAKLLRYRLSPEIPHEAQVANVSGTVVLHGIIDRNGRTRELQYVSGPLLLAEAAMSAAKWWEYEVDDENVEIETTIQVEFPPADN